VRGGAGASLFCAHFWFARTRRRSHIFGCARAWARGGGIFRAFGSLYYTGPHIFGCVRGRGLRHHIPRIWESLFYTGPHYITAFLCAFLVCARDGGATFLVVRARGRVAAAYSVHLGVSITRGRTFLVVCAAAAAVPRFKPFPSYFTPFPLPIYIYHQPSSSASTTLPLPTCHTWYHTVVESGGRWVTV